MPPCPFRFTYRIALPDHLVRDDMMGRAVPPVPPRLVPHCPPLPLPLGTLLASADRRKKKSANGILLLAAAQVWISKSSYCTCNALHRVCCAACCTESGGRAALAYAGGAFGRSFVVDILPASCLALARMLLDSRRGNLSDGLFVRRSEPGDGSGGASRRLWGTLSRSERLAITASNRHFSLLLFFLGPFYPAACLRPAALVNAVWMPLPPGWTACLANPVQSHALLLFFFE